MTPALPELDGLPSDLVLDGELVAWRDGVPHFPLVPRRILKRRRVDRAEVHGLRPPRPRRTSLVDRSYAERRFLLEQLHLEGPHWNATERFDDGEALWSGVGLEGVVAKRLTSRYDARRRGWVKIKNPDYWRRDAERESLARSRERPARSRRVAHSGQ